MRTSAYKVDVASDRRRRENVPRHILCSCVAYQYQARWTNFDFTENIKHQVTRDYLVYMKIHILFLKSRSCGLIRGETTKGY